MTAEGLYCAAGDFHIDPWRPVPCALITHAHADHARPGSTHYHAALSCIPLLRQRLGQDISASGHAFGTTTIFKDVAVTFHPAGHVLGSSQIRIESEGEVWVVSGDYKCDPDPAAEAFAPVACNVFITEATFALPIYRWEPIDQVMDELMAWWQENEAQGRASVVFCYALGKAQRLLAELARRTDRSVFVHGAIDALLPAYREAGVTLAETHPVREKVKGEPFGGALVLAPPSAFGSPWLRRFGDCGTAFCSGWMRVRGHRRRRGFDRGFVMSDHADWNGILKTIERTGASKVFATHGYSEALARYLNEQGLWAAPLTTLFDGEDDDG